jgi:hypothetical protein
MRLASSSDPVTAVNVVLYLEGEYWSTRTAQRSWVPREAV